MKRFSTKNLGVPGSFGEILRKSREHQGLSLSQVAFNLKIPARYLQALEQEALSSLPAGLYGHKFLREYASYLNLSPEPLLAEYQERLDRISVIKLKSINPRRLLYWPRFSLFKISLAVIFLVLLIYLVLEATSLFLPPPLTIINPPTNVISESLSIIVMGKTLPGVRVVLNGKAVMVDDQGGFRQVLALQPGLNTIEVSAKRSYSQQVKVLRQVLVPVLPQNPAP